MSTNTGRPKLKPGWALVRVAVMVPRQTLAELKRRAAAARRPVSEVARDLIEDALESLNL